MRKSERFKEVSSASFKASSDENHSLSILSAPEDGVTFEAEIDNSSDGTFNGPTAYGEVVCVLESIVHMRLMFDKIVELSAYRTAITAFAKGSDILNDLLDFAL